MPFWYRPRAPTLVMRSGTANGVQSLAFAPDGKGLAVAPGDRDVLLWDPATGQELQRLSVAQGALSAVTFSSDGALLAAAGANDTIHV